MEEAKQQLLTTIGSYVSKLLRDHFGKGPESVFVSLGSTYFTIYIRNFLSPMEKVLLEQDQEMVLLQLRQKIMAKLLPELRTFILLTTGREVAEVYYDWGLHNRSGMIFGLVSKPFEVGDGIDEHYAGKDELNKLIIKFSQSAQKLPDETYSFLLNPRTLVVIRNGILVRIEKELIRQGHNELLRNVKAQLEKGFLHNNERFEAVLKQRVLEVFVDWHFEMDKSVIVFILNPKKLPGGNDLDMAEPS